MLGLRPEELMLLAGFLLLLWLLGFRFSLRRVLTMTLVLGGGFLLLLEAFSF